MRSIYLCTIALIDSARGAQIHPLASYFLVRSSIALRLLSSEYRCLVLLDYVEDIYVGDPLFPLVLILHPPKNMYEVYNTTVSRPISYSYCHKCKIEV